MSFVCDNYRKSSIDKSIQLSIQTLQISKCQIWKWTGNVQDHWSISQWKCPYIYSIIVYKDVLHLNYVYWNVVIVYSSLMLFVVKIKLQISKCQISKWTGNVQDHWSISQWKCPYIYSIIVYKDVLHLNYIYWNVVIVYSSLMLFVVIIKLIQSIMMLALFFQT